MKPQRREEEDEQQDHGLSEADTLKEQGIFEVPGAEEYTTSSIKLSKDLKQAAINLQPHQVRYLVDIYYQLQRNRVRASNQTKQAEKSEKIPNELLGFMADHAWKLECSIKLAMKHYTLSKTEGIWLNSLHGIGPVLSAGLMAHLDVTVPKSVAGWWRFAGLDPTVTWKAGEKRPWNTRLKTLCWKVGDSIVKTHNSEKQFYGQYYKNRKKLEQLENEQGIFSDQAKAKLEKHKIGKTTIAYSHYSVGHLPPAHIDMRARRYVVKMLLSHIYEVFYEVHYGKKPARPYAFNILGHDDSHYIPPPNWDGLTKKVD